MESQTYIKYIRMSPKKFRFLLDFIKKQKPVDVLHMLKYDNKRTSHLFYKVIKSAITNAKNTLKVDENLLQFKVLTVEEGPALKRSKAGGRGNVNVFKRRTSHIKIVLSASKPAVLESTDTTPLQKESKKVTRLKKVTK